jgi:hypothetical protein
MRLAIVSLLVSAGALGCTPVKDYRVDHQKPADSEEDAGRKPAAEQAKPGKAQPDAAAESDKPSTKTGTAGAADSGEPKAGTGGPGEPKNTETVAGNAAPSSEAGAATQVQEVLSSEAQQQAGWAALTDWAALPTLRASITQLFSTHELGESVNYPLVDPGNKDFNSFLALCGEQPDTAGQQNNTSVACGDGQSGYLVAADDGPGYVSRILLARGVSTPSGTVTVDLRPMNERVRVYIDGEAAPVIDSLWSELADAKRAPFNAPLTGWTSGAIVSYLPISYSSRLRVFVDDLNASSTLTLYYAHVTTQRVQSTRPYSLDALTSEVARGELDRALAAPSSIGTSWLEQDVTLEGSAASMVWARSGAGTLQRIELQLPAASANEILTETSLRLSWDDAAPAIDLPLGTLFGSRHGVRPVTTLPLSVKSDGNTVSLSLSLPMPFAKSAKLELLHAAESSRTLKVRLSGTDGTPKGEWGYLRSTFVEQRDPQRGDRFRIAALSGRGKYIGTILYAHGKADPGGQTGASSELGFLDGDERLDVDGQATWLGTGTDNFFNGGFYFADGLFNSPFAALSQLDDNTSAGSSEATMMRWTMLTDEINFQKKLDLSFEFGANRPATVRDLAAVSLFYQQ